MAHISLPLPILPRRTQSSSPPSPIQNGDSDRLFIPFYASDSKKRHPSIGVDTPPSSPLSKISPIHHQLPLDLPYYYEETMVGFLQVYQVHASDVVAALSYLSTQYLPDASYMFPWLHGLHPNNYFQTEALTGKQPELTWTPTCFRGITLVKADGELCSSRLKGAVAPDDILTWENGIAEFRDINPRTGLSVRNFHIQETKLAMISDIVVYGDNQIQVIKVAGEIATAQKLLREEHSFHGLELLSYNSFICTSPFTIFERHYPDLVVLDSFGNPTHNLLDLSLQEKTEMRFMTRPSEIAKNVWLGPTPQHMMEPYSNDTELHQNFDIYIGCADIGRLNAENLSYENSREITFDTPKSFPAYYKYSPHENTSFTDNTEVDGIIRACKFIYLHSHGITSMAHDYDIHDDAWDLHKELEKKILIYCNDGYTESSLLGLSYLMFITGLSFSSVLIDLHVSKKRNFFVSPADIATLTNIYPKLIADSPFRPNAIPETSYLMGQDPKWLKNMSSFFPSRITCYMYLGNLSHANNPELLSQLGIRKVLSIGENISWEDTIKEEWGRENLKFIHGIEDNGLDSLLDQIDKCLDFIAKGRLHNTATLVHCKVGVSRSATICIAEIMRSLNMTFPRAYCFVRARRLNVIIQPHLRFVYELLKWEERLHCGSGPKREMEWTEISRQISAINKPFSR